MKILLFGPAYPFRGGVPVFTEALAAALGKAGHDVKIAGFAKLFPKWLFPGKSQFVESADATHLEPEREFVAWKPRTWKQTAQTIEAFDPELILAMWWMPTFGPGYRGVARALSAASRERLVYVIHDVVSHERRPGDMWLARMALKTARKFLVLSLAEAARLKQTLPTVKADDIHHAPHPPYVHYREFQGTRDEAKRALGVNAERVLLFFGFVRRYKGLDLLLKAMPEILGDHPDTQLLVCGPFHESRAKHEKLMDRLGIRERVVIHDRYFSGDDVGACFAAADAVVLPYRTATQSGVIPAAIALGTPVIATRAGGLDEAMKGHRIGEIIPEHQPRAVANAVKTFFAAGGRAAYEADMRAEAKRQSWEEMVKVIEKLASHVS